MDPLTIGASLLGGLLQSHAASKAAKAQQQAQQQALAAQRQAAGEARDLYAPSVAAYNQGLSALGARTGLGGEASPNALKDPMSGLSGGTFGNAQNPSYAAPAPFGPGNTNPGAAGPFSYGLSDYTASPGYQFQLEQGIKGIESSQAARGALNSGATLKALQRYGQDLAMQDFNNERAFASNRYDSDRAFNRDTYTDDRDFNRNSYADDRNYLTNRYDKQTDDLYNVTGLGQTGLTGTANAILGVGNAGADAAIGIGDAKAANARAQGGIWSGVVTSPSQQGGIFNALKTAFP